MFSLLEVDVDVEVEVEVEVCACEGEGPVCDSDDVEGIGEEGVLLTEVTLYDHQNQDTNERGKNALFRGTATLSAQLCSVLRHLQR